MTNSYSIFILCYSIAKAALTARAACSLGQGADAANKVDEMKRRIALVSELLANTMLELPSELGADGAGSLLQHSSPSGSSSQIQGSMPTHRATQSMPSVNLAQSPGLLGGFSPPNLGALPPTSAPLEQSISAGSSNTSHSGLTPESDNTRKRCASSISGNVPAVRSNKSQKMEPDGAMFPPLIPSPTPSPPALVPTLPGTQVPLRVSMGMTPGMLQQQQMMLNGAAGTSVATGAGSSNAPLTLSSMPIVKNPPSAPPSRPASPSMRSSWGIPIHPMTSSVPVGPGSAPLSVAPPAGAGGIVAPPPPFGGVPHPLNTAAAALTSSVPGVPSPTKSRPQWAELSGTGTMLGGPLGMVHSEVGGPGALPGVATLTGSSIPSLASFGASASTMPPSNYVSPTRLSQGQIATNAGSARPTRSSSLSGPVMFGSGNGEQHAAPEYAPTHSRARARSKPTNSTATLERRSRSMSSDEEDSDDDGPYALSGYGHHNGSGLMHSKMSPPLKSRDSSRERPSQRQRINGGSGQHSHSDSQMGANSMGGSGGHGNEIPPEYRAEVDRIFFEFMNKICSNREFATSLFSDSPVVLTSVLRFSLNFASVGDQR
jgi:hypothetical protein